MYASAKQLWQGFSKNIYEGIGGSLWALLLVIALYSVSFVVPYALLVYALLFGSSALQLVSAVAVGANRFARIVLALRFRHSVVSVVLHPVAVLLLLAIALNSWRWVRSGQLLWAGRVYPSRGKRLGAAP